MKINKNIIKCPKCNRDVWAVYRKKTIIEYRIINTKSGVGGLRGYKGNWKTEETKKSKVLGLRCMACSYETDGKDIEGYSGIEITNKGVIYITDFWDKYS